MKTARASLNFNQHWRIPAPRPLQLCCSAPWTGPHCCWCCSCTWGCWCHWWRQEAPAPAAAAAPAASAADAPFESGSAVVQSNWAFICVSVNLDDSTLERPLWGDGLSDASGWDFRWRWPLFRSWFFAEKKFVPMRMRFCWISSRVQENLPLPPLSHHPPHSHDPFGHLASSLLQFRCSNLWCMWVPTLQAMSADYFRHNCCWLIHTG